MNVVNISFQKIVQTIQKNFVLGCLVGDRVCTASGLAFRVKSK